MLPHSRLYVCHLFDAARASDPALRSLLCRSHRMRLGEHGSPAHRVHDGPLEVRRAFPASLGCYGAELCAAQTLKYLRHVNIDIT